LFTGSLLFHPFDVLQIVDAFCSSRASLAVSIRVIDTLTAVSVEGQAALANLSV